ncbi:hypothetical protein VOLCADRAFT_94949 [Volvox carteri f. nagariensis]|uniref:Uncharacterized protein n=1 Tax=Volvox carteri f. nagariensis TaxID=3068 RepID=D8U673_VOLCA|nr:uncharacterized protein VOLCADRAFT_94949 [Volvox carteri f. nagariensis]EFJ44890.1 hypothetical protein VOLCADRAFT_94949 [Volvox carteri f. nagariensis]|eukprot:XP_002954173.1 hypothetical protein VOLCADRAFT_94949 [Volvox carteri f. nagariensis]
MWRCAADWLSATGWRFATTAAHGAARQQQHHVGPQKKLGLKDVQHIVAITSAKGGVGKSTTAVNVAVAMATRLGLRVGLLDADIHGPSIPTLMNLKGKPALDKAGSQALMLPKENYRVKTMSFGFFLEHSLITS